LKREGCGVLALFGLARACLQRGSILAEWTNDATNEAN
jgi:hypothetical protein